MKEAKEAKRREQEEAAQAELNNWVEQFDGGGDEKPKAFVRGGVQGGTVGRGGGGAPPRDSGAPYKREPSAAARNMFNQADDGTSISASRPPCHFSWHLHGGTATRRPLTVLAF